MKTDYLALRNAEAHVDSYIKESTGLVERHAAAMDCRDYEAFLQMGIDAFDWLMRADRVIRLAVFHGDRDYDPIVELSLDELCRRWLQPCSVAEAWITIQQQRGFEIDNLAQFRKCVEEMRAIVAAGANPDHSLPEAIAEARDTALEEHRNGKTAEFL